MDFDLSGIFAPQYLPAIVTAFSGGLKAAGILGQGKAGVQAAERRQQAATFEADQLRINAGQAKAASQRDAYFKGLEGQRLMSAIQARAGAGGSDPTVLNIMASAMAQRSYNMQSALYGGDEKARLMRMQASGKEYDAALGLADAKRAKGAYTLAAVGALAESSGKSLFDKYWPKDAATSNASAGTLPQADDFDMTRYEP
jgi:hypothetical protein